MKTILIIIGLVIIGLMINHSIKMDKAVFESYNSQDVAKVVCNDNWCN